MESVNVEKLYRSIYALEGKSTVTVSFLAKIGSVEEFLIGDTSPVGDQIWERKCKFYIKENGLFEKEVLQDRRVGYIN